MSALPHPGKGATVGFACVAAFLAVLAIPPARDSVLLVPALFLLAAGVLALLFARGPRGARYAAAVAVAYVLVLLALFVASTPFTIGRYKWFVNETPPAWATEGFSRAVDVAPALLAIGAALAIVAWSGVAGRVAAAIGIALMLAFVTLHFVAPDTVEAGTDDPRTPEELSAERDRLDALATWGSLALSIGALASFGAAALVLARKPLALDWG